MSALTITSKFLAKVDQSSDVLGPLTPDQVLTLPLFVVALARRGELFALPGGSYQITWKVEGSSQMLVWQVDRCAALLLADNRVHSLTIKDLYLRLRHHLK